MVSDYSSRSECINYVSVIEQTTADLKDDCKEP